MCIRVCSTLSLFLLFFLGACAKKEPPPANEETSSEAAKPARTPGEMVLIPAGEFILGDNDKSSSAFPQQKLNLPAFWIDKYEVTGMEFLNFAAETGYTGQGAREGKDWRQFVTADKAYDPVVYITWDDALSYCKSKGKRLPTEEEWEKAGRGADGKRYPWGNDWKTDLSNTYEAGLHKPAPVGKFDGDVSSYGVHDMLGNVQEWTSNWYKAYKGNPKKDENFGERFRVVRGASSRMYGERTHLWDRSAYLPGSLYDFGCRCAKDAAPQEGGQGGETKK
jgi:formylglycine-generating enzyme required for sulfatase activity